MTIEALAAEASISWTYLSEIERGLRNPSWGVISSIAAALGVAVGDVERLADKQPASKG